MGGELIFLGLASLLAGLVDAVAGGGGLIQVPALMASLPGEGPARLFGTNKLASIFGTASAAIRYGRGLRLSWSWLLPAALAALVCSILGAATVAWLPRNLLRPLVLAMLLIVFLQTLCLPNLGLAKRDGWISYPARKLVAGIIVGAVLGFYDGFFGPGTGSFLVFLFVRLFGEDYLHASAAAKIVNVASNAGALLYFAPTAEILWPVAVVMACCNLLGAILGSHMALVRGNRFVRGVFLVVAAVLMVKIGYDLWIG